MQLKAFVLCYLTIIFSFSWAFCFIPRINTITGEINKTENLYVSNSNISIIYYNYFHITEEQPLKIRIELKDYIFKIGAVVKINNMVVNVIELLNMYNVRNLSAERTICPIFVVENSTMSVEISTESQIKALISVRVSIVQDFLLKMDEERELLINENMPTYLGLNLNSSVNIFEISIWSPDNSTCMIVSVQSAQCPVDEKLTNYKTRSVFQTVIHVGNIIIKGKDFFKKKIFIVFMITNDKSCFNKMSKIMTNNSSLHQKAFRVSIKELKTDIYLPVFGIIGFFLLFYLLAVIISILYGQCCSQATECSNEELERVVPLQNPVSFSSMSERADLRTIFTTNQRANQALRAKSSSAETTPANLSITVNDFSYDMLEDAFEDPNVFRLNKITFLSDFAQKPADILETKYFLYMWYLVIISVFYSLPVVQLLINYQKTLDITGNLDLCYYNFRCTRPLFIFTAFNNIISNSGYVLLGLLFTFITWRRQILYNEKKLVLQNPNYNKGIPQYYGLFYAMGLSLTMEGIMSACYHICPSSNNFQFDTAYMYILACLCLMKIYQTRHPDINATAHSFFMTMALFIFVGVLGVVTYNVAFLTLFIIMYIFLCAVITCEVYYVGRWRLDLTLFKRVYHLIQNDRWKVFIPDYRRRIISLVVFNVANLSLAIYGITKKGRNFPSYFLAIFMTNLLLYFGFYILMKIIHRERFHKTSIFYIIVGIICWGFSLYCFINHPTDWQKTPAGSRMENSNCIFLNYYDIHDIWHMLSAIAMFLSFMALQSIDDCLFKTERHMIQVF